VEKDIPEIIKVIGIECRYVEVKGRENYLCWNKYQAVISGKIGLDASELSFVEKILVWTQKTRSGDRKELGLPGDIMQHWPLVAAERRTCLRDNCPYSNRCFRIKMLRSLEKADLIVANHALLLADTLVEHSILPEYHHLIIDEAHAFDREAFDKLSLRLSYYEINDLLRFLASKEKKREKGYLQHLRSKYAHLAMLLTEAASALERFAYENQGLFNILGSFPGSGKENENAKVLKPADLRTPWFEDVMDRYFAWQENINLLLLVLRNLSKENEDDYDRGQLDNIIQALQETSDTGCFVFEEELEKRGRIMWLELKQGIAVAVASSLVNIGLSLQERIYDRLNSLVMLSATLAVEEDFSYFIERSGLLPYKKEDRLRTLLEHSPFDYEKQARLYTVDNMPDPLHPAYNKILTERLQDIIAATGGATMALFTSRKQLQETAAKIRPFCEQAGIRLLAQYEDGEFAFLMEEFMSSSKAVLMGLETFWEGIDLKGDLLRCVVIAKLPFRSPGDPYVCAGELYCQMNKKNSFQHFMLPDAAVRFKQGTGRLIRSEKDQGAVVVLDSRLDRKSYGTVFKNSIPIKQQETISGELLTSSLQQFLNMT